jgi:ribosomal-protein-alanine N-acetyltransferase
MGARSRECEGVDVGTIAVRPTTAADLDRVAAIEVGAFGDPWNREAFERLLGDNRVYFAVACLTGERGVQGDGADGEPATARTGAGNGRGGEGEGPRGGGARASTERGEMRGEHEVIAGYVVAWFVMDEGEIANLAVAAELRRRHIGATLLDAAIHAARSRHVSSVYLEVRDSNVAARALYASRGFVEIARRKRYYRKPVEDALVLRLVLPGG